MTNRFNDRIDIQTCRDQHVALTYLLDQFQTGGTVDETKTIDLLQRLRTVLVHHLRLEDDLYRRLRHSSNRTIRATAQKYQAETGNLAQALAEIHAGWTQPGAICGQPVDYMAHWSEFELALRKRMTAEDDLYTMAEAELVGD